MRLFQKNEKRKVLKVAEMKLVERASYLNRLANLRGTPDVKIKDAYPRLLLARTHQPEYDYEGLRIANLADWLADVG